MRGIEGVLQDYTGGKNSNAGVVVNINLNDMVVKEEADENRLINKMEQHLKRTLAEQQMIGGAILIDLNALEYNGRKRVNFHLKYLLK